MTFIPKHCARCGKGHTALIMSKFNTDMICCIGEGNCKEREKDHPQYAEADRAEMEAVRSGNMNFPGIGCPADLYIKETA